MAKRIFVSNRKIFLITLALCLLLTLVWTFTAIAQSLNEVSADDVSGYVGDEILVPVRLNNVSGAVGLQFQLFYDHTLVEPVLMDDPTHSGPGDPAQVPWFEQGPASGNTIVLTNVVEDGGQYGICLLYTSRCV